MYDFHLHSEYSIDSKSSMEDMVLSAIEKNLTSICFTDHVDFECSTEKIDIAFSTVDYFNEIKRIKHKYTKDIEILAGVEIGVQPHLFRRYNEFIDCNNFDFVLMSIHSVEKMDISFDNYTKGKIPIDAMEKYYKEMYQCVKEFDNFDTLGHIDYIDRYFEDYTNLPKYEEYQHLIVDVLKLIISKGKGIEINTAGIRYGLNYYHPKMQILKLYKELGGEIITIGSDAHTTDCIGYDYRNVARMLRDLGFNHIHIFKGRTKVPIKII